MPKVDLKYQSKKTKTLSDGLEYVYNSLSRWEFESFNQYVLGLGDVTLDGKYRDALVAFFDLEGFTSFCNQKDANKIVPSFLTHYQDWLLASLREGIKHSEAGMEVGLFGSLPFYCKFLGDGMLFIWDAENNMGEGGVFNTAYVCAGITRKYKREFYKHLSPHYPKMPARLRCGISRGQIISIGDGNDYVGSCINIACRLQKIEHYTFAISRQDFDLSLYPKHALAKILFPVYVNLRGIGESEPIYVLKDEVKKTD